jgi:spore maturation protein CgeB
MLQAGMRLAVLGPSLDFGKGSYILKSLAQGLSLLNSNIEVYPIGYNDIVLGLRDVYSHFPAMYNAVFPKVYNLSFRRGFKHVRLFSERYSFVKYVLKNFDCLLLSVTALSYLGVIELIKHRFPMILWDIDSPNLPYAEYSQYLSNGRYLLLCYSKGGCELWSKYGVNTIFFPLACDTNMFYPIKGSKKIVDILFTGRYLRDRENGYRIYLYPLIRRFHKSVVIVGSGWTDNPNVKDARIIPGIPYTLLNKFYNMAKVCINIHRDKARECYTALNLRTFEVLGSGQLLISDRVIGIDELFDVGKEVIVCDDGNEFLNNVEKYLLDDKARQRIAEAGYNKVIQSHTIMHRAKKLQEIIEGSFTLR